MNKLSVISIGFAFFGLNMAANATEFDQYLQQQKIIDAQYKIQNKKELNDLLAVLSAEDSKTLPLQIDQNTLIEKLVLTSNQTVLNGKITTPEFTALEKSLGKNEINKRIHENLTKNCPIFFEHEYQRRNPYSVKLILTSASANKYEVNFSLKDCNSK